MMNITDEHKTKLQTIISYWNENCVTSGTKYDEDAAAGVLLSLMIDKEFNRITRLKTEIRHYPNMNLKQYEAERAEFIRQGRMRPWD